MEFRDDFRKLINDYPQVLSDRKHFETTMKDWFGKNNRQSNIVICLFDKFEDIKEAEYLDDYLKEHLVEYLVDEHGKQEEYAKEAVNIVLEVYGQNILKKPYKNANTTKEDSVVEEEEFETWDDSTKFIYALDLYNKGNLRYASKLAEYYNDGKGGVQDIGKAAEIYTTIALKTRDKQAINWLATLFCLGKKDILKDQEYKDELDLLANKNANNEEVTKAGKALTLNKIENENDRKYIAEKEHLASVSKAIEDRIKELEERFDSFDRDTSWMDEDQREDWLDKKEENSRIQDEISDYTQIFLRPYYARIDIVGETAKTIYIGERRYTDKNNEENEISSVWSDIGKIYRAGNVTKFHRETGEYFVKLRRKIAIKDAELETVFDEYKAGQVLSDVIITDPFLMEILKEKHKEKHISNIIRSIQSKQNDIIEENLDKNIVVQGCAGSGKTMILLHRLANLKYQNDTFDWDRARIITPNHNFASYIDELSKNLEIESIVKSTLEEYLIELLANHYSLYGTQATHVKTWTEALTAELESDEQWSDKSGSAEFMYSDQFFALFKAKIANRKASKRFKEEYGHCSFIIDEILKENGFKKTITTSRALLLYEVLYMKLVFNREIMKERLLCIDEGQDIPEYCYILLSEIADNKCIFNIYGDLAQRLSDGINIGSWAALNSKFGAKQFNLYENFRNSAQIVDYYKKELGRKDEKGFGVESREVVENLKEDHYRFWMQLHLLLGNRVAFITRKPYEICAKYPDITSREIQPRKVTVLTVKEAKGMEFDTVFVDESGLNENERYIAYTRPLSNLYICEN